MTIGRRLTVAFGIILLILVIVAGTAIWMEQSVEVANNTAVEKMNDIIFTVEKEVDHLVWLNNLSGTLLLGHEFSGQLDPTKCDFGRWYLDVKNSDYYHEMSPDFRAVFESLEEPHRLLHESAGRVLGHLNAGDRERAMAVYTGETQAHIAEIRGFLDNLIRVLNGDKEEALAAAAAQQTSARGAIIWSTVAAVVLTVILTVFITRGITHPVNVLKGRMETAAKGDLTAEKLESGSRDEVGDLIRSFETMRSNMKELIAELKNKSEAVASAANQLNASAEETSAAASESASSMMDVSASVDELSENTQDIARRAQASADYAIAGKDGLDKLTSQMASITSITSHGVSVIDDLNQSTQKITQIVDVITGIADQTNLLALNAAIEAARAGEQGRGFAVVAEEVRKLAEQSGTAAKEIKQLIDGVRADAEATVKAMQDGNTEVQAGSKIIADVGQSFARIISEVQELADRVGQIAASAQQMSSAVQNVAAGNQETTAAMEEVAASTDELNKLAAEMEKMSRRFRV